MAMPQRGNSIEANKRRAEEKKAEGDGWRWKLCLFVGMQHGGRRDGWVTGGSPNGRR